MNSEQYCTFELDNLYLGLEATRVQEVLRAQPITEVPLAPFPIRGLMNMRGQIVLAQRETKRRGLLPGWPPADWVNPEKQPKPA